MNVGELRSLINDLSDNVEIHVGAVEVKEADVKHNQLVFDLDYEKEFYTANGQIYTYEYIINRLRRLNYFENGEPINMKHINSIGLTTANHFYMLDLEKIKNDGDITINEFFLNRVDGFEDITNFELFLINKTKDLLNDDLFLGDYNEISNILIDNVNNRIVFLSGNALEDYYHSQHKELVINDVINWILSQDTTELFTSDFEKFINVFNLSAREFEIALANEGITVTEFEEDES